MKASADSITTAQKRFDAALDEVKNLKDYDPDMPEFLKEDLAIVGHPGRWYVFQVTGPDSMLVKLSDDSDDVYCVKGVSTAGKVDDQPYSFDGLSYMAGETYTYSTVGGSSRTVYVFRAFTIDIDAALGVFRKKIIAPAIESALASVRTPVPPSDEQAAVLERKRARYREKELQRRQSELEQARRALRLQNEKRAASKLRLARQLIHDHAEEARAWLSDVISKYPSTLAAAEAEELLNGSDPQRFRVWTSGSFSTEAVLLGIDGENVVLKKKDGRTVEVPKSKLSDADRSYVVRTISVDPQNRGK